MYVLGIDGGGTKTIGVIADAQGEVVNKFSVGGSNLNSKQESEVTKELTDLINYFKKQNIEVFSQVKRVFAGMSGGESQSSKETITTIISSLMPSNTHVTIDNDAITALYSGTLGAHGVVQIAGTGSITFGVNQFGDRARVGGWGHLFSDDGSGYAIGRDGLREAFLAYDRLDKNSYINHLFIDYFQVNDLPEVIPMIYQGENPKEIIASLSKLVVEAADFGDVTAQGIINHHGNKLGESISTLNQKLFKHEEKVKCIPVVLVGGIFNRVDLFKDNIEKVIKGNHQHAEIIMPQILPVGGAVIAALREEQVEIDHEFSERFFDSIK